MMNKTNWKIYFFVIAGISLMLSCAQKPSSIEGKIIDEDGNPLAGAAVFSVPQRYSTLSDTLGNYKIEGIESGQYSLLAKLGDDSTLVNIGFIEAGIKIQKDIEIKLAPPPPPPAVEKKPTPKPKPKKEQDFVDPIYAGGTKVLLLADKDFISKFEIESSDGLAWELRKVRTSDTQFGKARLYEGYFPGPSSKYYDTAARRCIYDNKLWIFTQGPEEAPENGREVYISVPLGLPANADIDSIVAVYGFPKFPSDAAEGSVRFRMVGETISGDIPILIDWQKVEHNSNGRFYHESIPTLGDNRKISYITLEINSDGDTVWDSFLIRPMVYFSLK